MPTLKECLGKSIIPLPYQNELLSKVQSLALEHGVEKASMMAIQDLHGSASSELGKMLGQFGLDAKNLKDYSIKGMVKPAPAVDYGPFPVVGTQNTTFANRGEAPTKTIAQVGLPIAGAVAGTLLAGNPIAGFAAGSVIGGELANLAQGYTPTVGERVTQVAGMAPVGRPAGVVGAVVGNYVQQGIAKQVGQNVDQVAAGETPTPLAASEYYSPDMLAAGAAPAMAGALNKGAIAVDDFKAALKNGSSLREAVKTSTVGTFIRPDEISIEQKGRNAARARVEETTGEKIPVTVAEAIGKNEIAFNKNELTADGLAARQRVATWAASKHPELGNMDIETGSEFVRELLKDQGKAVSSAVARDVSESAQAISRQAFKEIKPKVFGTVDQSVNRLRGEADKGLKVAKDGYDKAYEEARATPGFSTIQVVPQEATLAAFKILEVPGITIDPKVKRVINSLSLGMDYDSAKSLKTYINDSIGTESLLPGVSDGQKKFLAGALSKDMDAALAGNQKAASLMKEANTKFAKAQESFNTLFAKQTIKSVGEEGGSTAGTITTKLAGSSGDGFLTQLREMARYNPEVIPAARDSIVSELIKEQGMNPQNLVKAIDGMATGVQAEFFPKLSDIKALANRAASLSKIQGLKGNDLLGAIKDTDAFTDALKDRSKGSVSKKITKLLDETAESISSFKNKVLQDANLAAQNPLDFVDGISSSRLYSPAQINEVMAKLPDEAKATVRQVMINRMLESAGGKADELIKVLDDPIRGARIKTVLGNDEYDFMVQTAKDLKTLELGTPDVKKPGSIISTLTRAAGVGAAAYAMTKSPYWTVGAMGVSAGTESAYNSIPHLQNLGASVKFKIAAELLSTPQMREMAVTPLDKMDYNQSRLLGAFLAEEIRRQEKSTQPAK